MKIKIVGILVVGLLMATVFPVGSLYGQKTIEKEKTIESMGEPENFLGTLEESWWIFDGPMKNPKVNASWREDNHYFFNKTSEITAKGNFSLICDVIFRESPGNITSRWSQCARFELFLSKDNKIINGLYDWRVITEFGNSKSVLKSIEIELNLEELNMEPGQNETKIKVTFHGWRYNNFLSFFNFYDYIDWLLTGRYDTYKVSQEIVVHFT